MATRKIALQLRLEENAHSKLKKIAEKELRSLNSQLEYFIIHGIEKYEREHGKVTVKNGDSHPEE